MNVVNEAVNEAVPNFEAVPEVPLTPGSCCRGRAFWRQFNG